jgi:hypothetical protein
MGLFPKLQMTVVCLVVTWLIYSERAGLPLSATRCLA